LVIRHTGWQNLFVNDGSVMERFLFFFSLSYFALSVELNNFPSLPEFCMPITASLFFTITIPPKNPQLPATLFPIFLPTPLHPSPPTFPLCPLRWAKSAGLFSSQNQPFSHDPPPLSRPPHCVFPHHLPTTFCSAQVTPFDHGSFK